jgi:hypothetical protein
VTLPVSYNFISRVPLYVHKVGKVAQQQIPVSFVQFRHVDLRLALLWFLRN